MSHLALYEIAGEYQQLFQELTQMEDTDENMVRDTLAHVQDQVEIKAVNVAAYIKNLEAEALAIKSAQENLALRQKRVSAKINHLKHYLRDNLKHCGINKIHHPLLNITLVKNPPKLHIKDVELIPTEYAYVKQTRVVNERKIKRALQHGCKVPGCELTQDESIRIR
ncbi:MAG: hypothetical protein K0S11_723 [Gammaproteobacteria bacterium]|jgi:hypothetical protein|nr:hypothetical protein [Gammaproteobacteria bacterium]